MYIFTLKGATLRRLRRLRKQKHSFLCLIWLAVLLPSFSVFRSILFNENGAARGVDRNRLPPIESSSKMKYRESLALIFYSSPRSLKWTLPSIRMNIITPLRHSFNLDLYLHTFIHNEKYSNRRTQEVKITLNNSEWQALQPDFYEIESFELASARLQSLYTKLKKFGDAWDDKYESLFRCIVADYSLMRATNLAQNSGRHYDGMLIYRPDMLYIDPIDIDVLRIAISTRSIVFPSWSSKNGMNDRYSYGSYDLMLLMGNRLAGFIKFCEMKKRKYHAEKYLKWLFGPERGFESFPNGSITKNLGHQPLKIECTSQRAVRVRADSTCKSEDFIPDLDLCPGKIKDAQITPFSSSGLSVNCGDMVSDLLDFPPVRSPQIVHTFIAQEVLGKSILELGTRNGDGISCISKTASTSAAIEYDISYCTKLKERAKHNNLTYSVKCEDFFKSTDLDADFITWWQQSPLRNDAVLRKLRSEQCRGRIRSSAQVILLFDESWPRDMKDFYSLKGIFSWYVKIPFDEKKLCLRDQNERSKRKAYDCRRASGTFRVAGILLKSYPNVACLKNSHCS